ncbi:serine/threonine-protein phosphatase 7 long form like [Fagus crenata]
MEEPLELDTIVEVREELMVSSSGGNPTLRIAHFLKPTITSIEGPVFKLPPPILEPQKLSLRVSFRGWRCAQNNWKTWVDKMASLHQATWKRAGIYEAVLNSTYQIRRDNDLVFGFAKRWCSETNTFIFPWGEATITLEDIRVLGAYSVLGDSVLCPVESKELKEIENNLKEMRIEICRTKARKASQTLWLKKFMDSGNEFEHEAFLSFWLCRYVLQNSSETIREYVFSIAIHLARGRKIALAPAVLASIYKDLSLLKEKIVDSHKSEADNDDDDDDDDEDGVLELKIFSPFHLVQIWAWERFLELRPNPNLINYGDPRMARWDQVKGSEIEIVSLALDSAGESFQWRPYAMGDCNFPKFYAEKEMFVSVGLGLDEELQSFARCLRVSELVGLGCIEQYLPHRVAMQFGLDQDLPGCVDRLNETSEIAWNHYSKPKHNMKLYVPSRLFEADVTVKYLEWWKQSIRSQQDASKGAVLQQREPRDSKGKEGTNKDCIPAKSSKKPHKKSKGKRKANDLHVTPGFSSKFNRMGMGNCNEEDGLTIAERMKFTDKHKNFVNGQGPQGGEAVNSFCQFEILSSSSSSSSSSDNGPVINLGKKDVAKGVTECQGDSNISKQSSKTSKGRMIDNTASIPPSFPPKCKIVEVGDSDEEDKITVKELLRSCNITNGVGNKMSGNGKPLSGAKSHDLSSSTADNGEVRKIESLVEPVGNIMQGEVVIGNAEGSMEDANASKEGSEAFTMESINGFEGARSSSSTFEIPGLELEARISKLEKVVAKLKAARFGNKFEKNPTKEGLSGL